MTQARFIALLLPVILKHQVREKKTEFLVIEKERPKSKSKFSSNLQIAIWETLCLLFVHLCRREKKVSSKIPKYEPDNALDETKREEAVT